MRHYTRTTWEAARAAVPMLQTVVAELGARRVDTVSLADVRAYRAFSVGLVRAACACARVAFVHVPAADRRALGVFEVAEALLAGRAAHDLAHLDAAVSDACRYAERRSTGEPARHAVLAVRAAVLTGGAPAAARHAAEETEVAARWAARWAAHAACGREPPTQVLGAVAWEVRRRMVALVREHLPWRVVAAC